MKFFSAATFLLASQATAFLPMSALLSTTPVSSTQMHSFNQDLSKTGKAAVAASCLVFPLHQAMSKADLQQLSYLQVKVTGLANRCSDVVGDDCRLVF